MTPERRRLHRAAILAEGLGQLRALALPLIVATFAGGGVSMAVWLAPIGAVVALIGAFVIWRNTAWWVDGSSIRLESGVWTTKQVSVPIDRVQAIDTVRGPAQRLLGAVEVHVQTAGGGARGEIVLRAVAPSVAEELRGLVRGSSPSAPAAPSAPGPSWTLGRRGLLVAALTSGSLGVLVPIVAGASQVLDDVLGPEDAERLLPDTPQEWLMAAVAVLVIAWLLSVLGTIVAFAGFSVTRDGDRLRIRRGIVERREASVPIARVAALRVVESPLREPFGLAQVRLESAGYANEPATAQALLPLVRRRDVVAVVERLLPELAESEPTPLAAPPRRALRRYVVPPTATAALVPLVLVPFLGAQALAALALPLAAAAYGVLAYRAAGWSLDADRLVLRRRGLQRTTLVADARRLPELFARTSPLQRRAGLATLGVAVSSGRRVAVRHLEARATGDLLRRLTRAATRA
ncbi:MAG TPA: PH domain-containing protein [Solirubrobacteraceae bacterium]|nr:PH domain-containing protein [Solirubrobacteraceae bacterium]